MEPLNTPLIRERIKTAHNSFREAVGLLPTKIDDDHKLLLGKMVTRVKAILDCFVSEGVIDNITSAPSDSSIESDLFCTGFIIGKKGFSKRIYVWMDGKNIAIKTPVYPLHSGLNFGEEPYECIRNINIENYNWVEFVDRLLYFIHGVIYQRQESYTVKIFGSR